MSSPTALPSTPAGLAGLLVEVTTALQGLDLDTLADDQIRELTRPTTTVIRRLQALQTRLAGTLDTRARQAARAAADASPAGRATADRDADRAAKDVRDDLIDQLQLSPSQAKQLTDTDRLLADLPATRQAFHAGRLTLDHVRLLHKAIHRFPTAQRTRLEALLVDDAVRQDPVSFGRTCRAVVAQLDPQLAHKDSTDQHAGRSARIAQRPDGTTWLGVEVSGVDGEFLQATIDAFRTADADGERRTWEQRSADAVMTMVRAAAGTLDDPDARCGVPVFLLQLPADQLLGQDERARLRAGNGLTTFTGPLPLADLDRLIGDSHVAALLADRDGLPLAVTRQVRTVPVGLWRLLVARDRGCITAGCDARPGWCQVAHLADPYRKRGKLAPNTAGLLCHRHHTAFDNGRLTLTWTDGRPVVHRRTAPPHHRRPAPPPLWERIATDLTWPTTDQNQPPDHADPPERADHTDPPGGTDPPGLPDHVPEANPADPEGSPDPVIDACPADPPGPLGPARDGRGSHGSDPPRPVAA
jgi:hypothetical protein